MTRGTIERAGLALAAAAALASIPAHGRTQGPRLPVTADAQRVLRDLHGDEVRSLRGLKLDSIPVVGEIVADELVDTLSLVSGAAAGVTPQALEGVYAGQLERLHLRALPKQQWQKFRPFLKIKVELGTGTTPKGPYVGLVKVALTQAVGLVQVLPWRQRIGSTTTWRLDSLDTDKLLYAETWHTQVPFSTTDPRTIVQTVRKLVAEQFLNDHRAANLRS